MLNPCLDTRVGGSSCYYWGDRRQLMVVPPSVLKCVAFLGHRQGISYRYRGTGFFISFVGENGHYRFTYFVTAKHVVARMKDVSPDGKMILRINRTNGKSEVAEVDDQHWFFHPDDDTVDIAVVGTEIPLTKEFDHETFQISDKSAVSDDLIMSRGVGPGDEICVAGLLT